MEYPSKARIYSEKTRSSDSRDILRCTTRKRCRTIRYKPKNKTTYISNDIKMLCDLAWCVFKMRVDSLCLSNTLSFLLSSFQGRRVIRPYFQKTRALAFTYDVITCIVTALCVAEGGVPFQLLELRLSLDYWK